MESVLPYVLAIVPTIGMGTLFYFVIKSILEGDRRERLAQARWEAAHDRDTTASTASTASAPAGDLPRKAPGQPASDSSSTGR